MRYSTSVCMDCPDRRVGCHSICEKYITQSEQRRKENEAEYMQRQIDMDQIDRKKEARFRILKRRGRKT